MRAISATPEEIRKVFSSTYIIPNFQRPYSWEIEQCEKLWDDIIDFYNNSTSAKDKYFLGNVVLHPSDENENIYSVIDGQQRLTTLLILIKALHSKATTVTALEECFKIKDPLTAKLTDEIRLNSQVLEDDKKTLSDIIINNDTSAEKSLIVKNYKYFLSKIDEWLQLNNNSSESFNRFILSLLDNVVLLPIHCESEDDALTIFETINNRGMYLSDADIFKSKLYAKSNDNLKQKFINNWNALEDHNNLFRIYMHIIRANKGDVSKEIALRSFFNQSHKVNYLEDVESVMHSLKMINAIEQNWYGSTNISVYWKILDLYPNYYWKFPLFVYLHKHGKLNVNDEFNLDSNKIVDFEKLMSETIKYFFIKGVVGNSVNTVKDTTFRVCAAIAKCDDYVCEYKAHLNSDYMQFKFNIENNHMGRCQRGIVILSAYLNPNQNKEDFAESFSQNGFHIEHILPQKWSDNNDWNKKDAESILNTLGNLIPFEKKLNISATNAFFGKKKEHYKTSKVQDALDLIKLKQWTKVLSKKAQAQKIERLLQFFEI